MSFLLDQKLNMNQAERTSAEASSVASSTLPSATLPKAILQFRSRDALVGSASTSLDLLEFFIFGYLLVCARTRARARERENFVPDHTYTCRINRLFSSR